MRVDDMNEEAVKRYIAGVLANVQSFVDANKDNAEFLLLVASWLESAVEDADNEDLFGTEGLMRDE
ncbi:hypothetical protein [Taklimakanibacter albus]|uniref:Uncharacterized protein n=1 Tax=Taklimakanibacter albus TaxID=2800327 RepID=A0ACC5RFX9_9HYPH|nr:hypothetical protein [Aestuariivirga sp. YIM B02566]MBK1871550.1 hypothetical protein [Aestuariivirga sp. YIM B02566]